MQWTYNKWAGRAGNALAGLLLAGLFSAPWWA
jgi:hypothetical protein